MILASELGYVLKGPVSTSSVGTTWAPKPLLDSPRGTHPTFLYPLASVSLTSLGAVKSLSSQAVSELTESAAPTEGPGSCVMDKFVKHCLTFPLLVGL